MMRLNLFFILCMVLSSAQDDKCVMVASYNGPISLINLPSMTGSIIQNQPFINSLAPDKCNNIVYGLTWQGGDLYAFDICNGGKTLVKSGVLSYVWALAYNPKSQLFYAVKNYRNLYTIDTNNNYAASFKGLVSHPFEGLVFNRAFTKLYAYTNIGENKGVYTIELPSYTTTQVASASGAGALSIEWENENDELKMILPSRYSTTTQLWSLDINADNYTVIGDIPAGFASGAHAIRGIAVFYDACDAICSDADGDGIVDACDNCIDVFNPAQEDLNDDGKGDACDEPPDCSMAYPSPTDNYGPPFDHRMIIIGIEGIVDLETSSAFITYNVISIMQDEHVCDEGSGSTSRDAICSIHNQNEIQVRRERTGAGDGRFYHITFEAFDNLQNSCVGSITVGIGHDASTTKVWNDQGPMYDSCDTTSCPESEQEVGDGPLAKIEAATNGDDDSDDESDANTKVINEESIVPNDANTNTSSSHGIESISSPFIIAVIVCSVIIVLVFIGFIIFKYVTKRKSTVEKELKELKSLNELNNTTTTVQMDN